jgi:predicted ATP-grasp superfamily ATP-dependent carboligase
MDALRWDEQPSLRQPVLLTAFEGWTDAGGAATSAAGYLAKQWKARRFASVDAEEFYDFTVQRPQVRLGERSRFLTWPENRFLPSTIPGGGDVVIMVGIEPHLRWRSFCACVTTLATTLDVEMVVVLGAMLGDVAHTRPTPVSGSTMDPGLAERFGLIRPRYQGPTGIGGVLTDACGKVGLPVASFMAQVPHYASNVPSPKATLAIVRRVSELLKSQVDTASLERSAATYEREVSEVVEADDDIARYVKQLEERSDEESLQHGLGSLPSGEALAEELERFLREQGSS